MASHQSLNAAIRPCSSARTAAEIVGLLASRQMLMKIGTSSTSLGRGPLRLFPR